MSQAFIFFFNFIFLKYADSKYWQIFGIVLFLFYTLLFCLLHKYKYTTVTVDSVMKASTIKTGRQDWDNCSYSLFTSSLCLWHLCVWLKHQRQSEDNELVVLIFSVTEEETARPQSCHTWVHTVVEAESRDVDVNSSMDDGLQMHASDDCCRCSLTVFICKLPCFITLTNIAHSCVGKLDYSCVIPVIMIAYVYICSVMCVSACRHRSQVEM